MVIVMKPGAPQEIIEKIEKKMISLGCEVHMVQGASYCVLGLIGDTNKINQGQIEANDYVEKVLRVQHPFKLASRLFHPENTVVQVDGVKIGDGNVTIMAGPCSVESEEQLMTTAFAVQREGAHILRGGAFKPRTSPYSFQGMGEEGLKILRKAKEATGMPIVTEVMCQDTFDIVEEYADILQIGARNMQNFPLLKRAGKSQRPILLKRGLSATIEELLMSAEYIMAEGNHNVILCERGVRTFETYTRNTFDVSAVPVIKELSHLPIVTDPSHATGKWSMVDPLAKASVAAGADGLIIEVHHQPEVALCDGAQSLKPEKFARLMRGIEKLVAIR
ncbi:3-deoxy-7-phosphoheptulonate synthase [Clostridium formicaceticum]|uniref:3-deoxy-7-phosphoheptulonate synthase n=1 Tax=Clostridium formicaceticum TaxID=1497 RepID=A0AAC9RG30_9CLOT|nr:3-deoxy-7-phosphoheptulonate synthase [Clostridium formicaceticum]AOY75805.1 3-deoxy-7-phosphoheptulonate synthase [Clostridium formicaceticum]ARE86134.1 Phospho-2-dehydro-3-deoxyheptonate aldolase [Clostridium formicaceticum]